MAWRIEYAESVHKSVRRPDRQVQRRLLDFPELRLAHMNNPRQPGTALQGTRYHDLWRCRVCTYRFIAEIDDDGVGIPVVRTAHRRDTYR